MTVPDPRDFSALAVIGHQSRLAETLNPAELDTLAHLARAGTGANSLRALASDLAYLEAWSCAATGELLTWPASEATVLRFIAHHLWDADERAKNGDHGMPDAIAAALGSSQNLPKILR